MVLVWLYLPDPWNLTCCEIVFLWHFFFCAKSEEARLPCWLEEEAATVEFLCPAKIIIMITRAKPAYGRRGPGWDRGARIQFKRLHFGVFSRLASRLQRSARIGYCCSNHLGLKTGRLKYLGTNLDFSHQLLQISIQIFAFYFYHEKVSIFLVWRGVPTGLLE